MPVRSQNGLAHCLFEISALLQILFDQVRNDLGVSLGNELMILLPEFFFQF